jgi:hypothetical protein
MSKLIKVAMIVAGVGAMLSFAGCGSAENKPEEVVLKVLKTLQAGKIDQGFLSKYCEEDTAKLFSGFGAAMTKALKGATFDVAYSYVDDDVAVVKIKQNGGDKPGESYYDAKKIDGQWKIQVNKEAHSDYYCGPSQKSISECVGALKAVFLENDFNAKYGERFTKKTWEHLKKDLKENPLSPDERKKLEGLKVKGINKRYDGSVEIETEGDEGFPPLKFVDGFWKIDMDQKFKD